MLRGLRKSASFLLPHRLIPIQFQGATGEESQEPRQTTTQRAQCTTRASPAPTNPGQSQAEGRISCLSCPILSSPLLAFQILSSPINNARKQANKQTNQQRIHRRQARPLLRSRGEAVLAGLLAGGVAGWVDLLVVVGSSVHQSAGRPARVLF
jgi:hypothetical protein